MIIQDAKMANSSSKLQRLAREPGSARKSSSRNRGPYENQTHLKVSVSKLVKQPEMERCQSALQINNQGVFDNENF